ncbi:hypothetical protein Bca52824_080054 [Brassica carinata]|uniref:NB-ARC domain-containing protein n=1 Tax=Brassica carinata TaxID=52824 RepID=A0A8X7TZK5_BRACI|nr:hypothetical protein Bca52824_080054 [Brassica carinata]
MIYRYGEKVILMLREVESLIPQEEFAEVTDETPIAEGEELPIQPTIGQETMLEMVWNRLMEDEVGIVGLYGMGGVGKTTLLTQINNRFSNRGGGFDVVIWVVVSQNATVRKIQGSIGEKLGLKGKEWDEKTDMDRARDILKVDDQIEVRCLDTVKAWDLFKTNVGETTLGSHPDIPELAMKVAEKCRGLPLALNVIGGTMVRKRSVQEWRRAVDVLTSSATEFPGVEDEVLPILKYSYDSLDGETTKSCFLYCSLFPEDGLIDKERMIAYWIGEGFIDEKESRERTINQGYEILELPFGFDQLKMLIHLNLECMNSLERLDGISGLSSLRTLKLLDCGVLLDMSLMKELQLLEHVEYITLSISASTLVGGKLFDDPRTGRCIQYVTIEEPGEEEPVKVIVLPALDGL